MVATPHNKSIEYDSMEWERIAWDGRHPPLPFLSFATSSHLHLIDSIALGWDKGQKEPPVRATSTTHLHAQTGCACVVVYCGQVPRVIRSGAVIADGKMKMSINFIS